MKKIRSLIAVLMIPLFFLACATFVKNSYITADSTGITYNTVMTGVGAATVTGKITAEQRANINKYGLIFYNFDQVALDGLANYVDNPATNTQTAVTLAITTALSSWIDLANLINSILPGSVPVSSLNAISLKGKTTAGQKFTVTVKKLDTGEISILIQIGATVLQYLVPAIQNLINDIGKISISSDDIRALKVMIKPPDQY
jgi:hypothetical protein